MNVSVAITNHNQQESVEFCIEELMKQTFLPHEIFVLSDAKAFKTSNKLVRCINNKKLKGRCDNRNSVIPYFLDSSADAIIFMDGDTYPKNKDFIEKYIVLLNKYDLIFGTREHTSIKGLTNPPSDLLTANMDELWQKKKLNYQDLRIVSKAVDTWQETKSFNERIDLMITGMIGWSCNFALTRCGIEQLCNFLEDNYNLKDCIFDSVTFDGTWGYEDVAMGIDALYAGLDIWITDEVPIMHKAHERSDGLFDHVKGRHRIMDRYRFNEEKMQVKPNITFIIMAIVSFFIVGTVIGLIGGFCLAN